MRVLHLLRKYNPAEWGGTETALQRLFEGLRPQGVDAVVYCPRNGEDHAGADPLADAGAVIKRFHACLPVWGLSPAQRKQFVAVGGNLMSFDLPVKLWREKDIQVVHSHTLGRLGGMARTLARRRRLPLVVTIHGGVLDLPAPLKAQMHAPLPGGWEWGKPFGLLFRARRVLEDADAILTCNPREAALLKEKYPAQRIQVQPHGVPVDRYQTDHRDAAYRAFPQIRNKQVLLAVGRIDAVKNQGWVIEQMPMLIRNHPQALLVLAGACTDAAYGVLLIRQLQKLGLEQRVVLTGGLPPGDPRLIGLMQAASAVLLPSVSETFGLVILEAWAAGTLAIASRTSGALALIEPGRNGWLFDLANPLTFHAAVDQTLLDPMRAAHLAEAGRQLARSEYDTAVLAGRMKQLYEQLLAQKHALRHSS